MAAPDDRSQMTEFQAGDLGSDVLRRSSSSRIRTSVFQVGDLVQNLSVITVRRGESLDSEILEEDLESGTLMKVLELGVGRRLHIVTADGELSGWVSTETAKKKPLLEPAPAAPSGARAAPAAGGGAASPAADADLEAPAKPTDGAAAAAQRPARAAARWPRARAAAGGLASLALVLAAAHWWSPLGPPPPSPGPAGPRPQGPRPPRPTPQPPPPQEDPRLLRARAELDKARGAARQLESKAKSAQEISRRDSAELARARAQLHNATAQARAAAQHAASARRRAEALERGAREGWPWARAQPGVAALAGALGAAGVFGPDAFVSRYAKAAGVGAGSLLVSASLAFALAGAGGGSYAAAVAETAAGQAPWAASAALALLGLLGALRWLTGFECRLVRVVDTLVVSSETGEVQATLGL